MPVQLDPPGQLQEFLEILKKRRWQVILPAAFCLSVGVAFAVVVPKKYEVTTQVELRETLYGVGGLELRDSQQLSTREAANAPFQIMAQARIQSVVEKLKWTDFLALDREEQRDYLETIQENITVTIPRKASNIGSTFVTIEYLDVDPRRAEEFLRELRTAWIAEVVERDRNKIRQEYKTLVEQRGGYVKALAKEQAARQDLKKRYNISPTQPAPGRFQIRDEDPSYARLKALEQQVDAADLEQGRRKLLVNTLTEQLAATDESIPRTDVVGGRSFEEALVELRTARSGLENTLRLEGYRPSHSTYKKLQRRIAEIDERIAEMEKQVTRGEIQTSHVPNPEWLELDARLREAQLSHDLALQEVAALREQKSGLEETVRQLQEVYREDSERETEIQRLEGSLSAIDITIQNKKQQLDFVDGPAGNPFAITQEVVPPSSPSEPNPFLIIAFGLVAGLALGVGSAVLVEFSRSTFKSAADIGRVMVVPVLGVVNEIVTGAQRRGRLARRFTVGFSSALLIGAVVFVTWAWAFQPDLLNASLRDGIEEFRNLFR